MSIFYGKPSTAGRSPFGRGGLRRCGGFGAAGLRRLGRRFCFRRLADAARGLALGPLRGRLATGAEAGALAGAEAAEEGLLGEEAVWSIADVIPMGTTAAVALLEHRWAIPLRDAIRRAGGVPLADTWVHPEDLVAAGAALGSSD